ncbi:MAG: chromate transporter [Clostridia bacterium]|nr:chromate transporter [Clostridia bacterium]
MIYLRLFFEFFKAGLFAVGGGLATLPFLDAMATNTGWFTHQQLADMVAISESTPGPIGVNMATYVGFTTAGIPGSIIATLGLITPSLIIIIIVAAILNRFKENRIVQDIFYGLRPASLGLITAAFVSLVTMSIMTLGEVSFAGGINLVIDCKALILALVLYVLTNKTKLHPAFFLLGSAIVGAVFSFAGA